MHPTTTLGAVNDFLIIGGIMAAILGIGVVAWRAEQKRMRELAAGLALAGLEVVTSPTDEQKRSAFEALGPFRDLRDGPRGIVWFARGHVQGREVTLGEHKYTTGSGKNRTTVRHTVAAIAASERWPALSLAEENLLHKIAEMFGSKDLKLEDEAFNKRWRVSADDTEFATLVLSPEVQAWSMALPARTIIRVGRGGMGLATNWGVKLENAQRLVSSVSELASLLPPELDAWGVA